jgi:hypothetical protein
VAVQIARWRRPIMRSARGASLGTAVRGDLDERNILPENDLRVLAARLARLMLVGGVETDFENPPSWCAVEALAGRERPSDEESGREGVGRHLRLRKCFTRPPPPGGASPRQAARTATANLGTAPRTMSERRLVTREAQRDKHDDHHANY